MDAADTAALVTRLRPWLGVFMHRASTWALKNPARTQDGVVFRFHWDPLQDNEDERAVVKLREAIDLVYRALALHTCLALSFSQETEDSMWTPIKDLSEPSVKRQLLHDAPFEMEVSVGFQHLKDASLLKRKFADAFFIELNYTPSTDAAFLEVRAHLDALLESTKPRWVELVALNPIKVKCSIDTASRLAMTAPQAEEFFGQLAAFTNVLEKYEPLPSRRPHHLPLDPAIAFACLSPTPISAAVATAVAAMVDMKRASPKHTFVTIDPRLVTCSREELEVFLRAIRATVVELYPGRFGIEETLPMDVGVDITRLLRDMLTAVSECEAVTTVYIGGLLALFSDQRSRLEVVQILVDTIMARGKPLNLAFRFCWLGELEASAFSSIARHWKSENPHKKLRVQRLELECYDMNALFTHAILQDLDEVEELSITNGDGNAPYISTLQISDLLDKFTMLRELSLSYVDLDSMHVFSEHAPPTLESLSLTGLNLGDRHSFVEFLQELSCPERPLARQLRRLSISEFSQAEYKEFRLGELEVMYLASTLRVNRVLESVRVGLEEEEFDGTMEQNRILTSAAGSVVPAPPAVRLSDAEKARRVAFLSVVHNFQVDRPSRQLSVLDTFLIARVFAFSDPCVPRFIRTD